MIVSKIIHFYNNCRNSANKYRLPFSSFDEYDGYLERSTRKSPCISLRTQELELALSPKCISILIASNFKIRVRVYIMRAELEAYVDEKNKGFFFYFPRRMNESAGAVMAFQRCF